MSFGIKTAVGTITPTSSLWIVCIVVTCVFSGSPTCEVFLSPDWRRERLWNHLGTGNQGCHPDDTWRPPLPLYVGFNNLTFYLCASYLSVVGGQLSPDLRNSLFFVSWINCFYGSSTVYWPILAFVLFNNLFTVVCTDCWCSTIDLNLVHFGVRLFLNAVWKKDFDLCNICLRCGGGCTTQTEN